MNSILCNYNPNSTLSLVPKITTTKTGSLDGCSFPFLTFLRKNVKKDVISNKKNVKNFYERPIFNFLDVFCAIKHQVRCIFSWRFLNIKKYLIIFWRFKNVKKFIKKFLTFLKRQDNSKKSLMFLKTSRNFNLFFSL